MLAQPKDRIFVRSHFTDRINTLVDRRKDSLVETTVKKFLTNSMHMHM